MDHLKLKKLPTLAPKTLSAVAAFNEDGDSELEEMPPESKMRMKNIGSAKPTSAGPKSLNRGKHGFVNNQKLWEQNIKSYLGNVHDQNNEMICFEIGVWGGYKVKRNSFLFKEWHKTIFGAAPHPFFKD